MRKTEVKGEGEDTDGYNKSNPSICSNKTCATQIEKKNAK